MANHLRHPIRLLLLTLVGLVGLALSTYAGRVWQESRFPTPGTVVVFTDGTVAYGQFHHDWVGRGVLVDSTGAEHVFRHCRSLTSRRISRESHQPLQSWRRWLPSVLVIVAALLAVRWISIRERADALPAAPRHV